MQRIIMRLRGILVMALTLSCISAVASSDTASAAERRCFNETGHCIEGRFREYWQQNGGLAVFGYPVTPAVEEWNVDLGKRVLTQWFERNRFELHPENRPPYDVLLGRLGADQLRKMGITWQAEPRGTQQNDCLWFAETQHAICDQAAGMGFKSYWQNHGLTFDGRAGISYQESLALFGLPLTEPRMETNASGDTVLTQWFERARFEWHPNKPDPFKVLLGLLGNDVRVPLVRTQHPGLSGRLLIQANNGLYLVQADGSSVRPLPFDPSAGGGFAIAPNNTKVALKCSTNGGIGLCTANLDGSNLTRINTDPFVQVLSWSPDGTRIAYESGSDTTNRRGLHVINADGSSDILVMAGEPGLMQANASWSPDSRRLTFNTVFSEHAIYVVNADGTQLRKVAPEGDNPQWSPDGSRIAFDSGAAGNLDIYVVNPDGTGLKQLTTSAAAESRPAWSPDGSRIGYHWVGVVEPNPAGAPTGIYTMRADGSSPVEVLHSEPTYSFGGFVWSPEGNYIAASRACPRLCGPQQTWGAKADGSEQFLMLAGDSPASSAQVIDWLP